MSKQYQNTQIVKHALQYYVTRPNASERDLKDNVLIAILNVSILIASIFLICHFNNGLWILFYILFHFVLSSEKEENQKKGNK